jgi:hypothetical protein
MGKGYVAVAYASFTGKGTVSKRHPCADTLAYATAGGNAALIAILTRREAGCGKVPSRRGVDGGRLWQYTSRLPTTSGVMLLHHYTRADNLLLILSNRTLRFTRADLLDDESEVPFQAKHLDPRKFFISSWSAGTHGEAGMWSRYGDGDRGVRLSVPNALFAWTQLTAEVSRETGKLKADGSSEKVGLRVRDLVTPYDRATFFGHGYIAVPMSADLRATLGAPVIYSAEPGLEAERTVTLTESGITFQGDGTRVARIKGLGWSDQAEYRFVISAIKGPERDYVLDPVGYQTALLDTMMASQKSGFANFHPDVRHIDLPLAPRAFDGLTVTLGPAMTMGQRDTLRQQVASLIPAAKVVDCGLRIRPKS